jgi:hypothetical protein
VRTKRSANPFARGARIGALITRAPIDLITLVEGTDELRITVADQERDQPRTRKLDRDPQATSSYSWTSTPRRSRLRNFATVMSACPGPMEAATWEPLEPMSSKSTAVWGYRGKLKRFSELRLRVPGDPYPAWTNVGVTELFLPEAVVEIRCVALIPKDAG